MKKWSINSRYLEIPLVPAHYGENAGVAGGAALCLSLLYSELSYFFGGSFGGISA